MRNSLRFIRILTVLGLFTGLAGAQAAPFTCVSNVTVTPALRGEGYTERTGDIAIQCAGGTAIAPGSAIPAVNITIFYNTTVTSRLMPQAGSAQRLRSPIADRRAGFRTAWLRVVASPGTLHHAADGLPGVCWRRSWPNLRPGSFQRHHAGPERVSGCSEWHVRYLLRHSRSATRRPPVHASLSNHQRSGGRYTFSGRRPGPGQPGSGVDRHQRQHLVPYCEPDSHCRLRIGWPHRHDLGQPRNCPSAPARPGPRSTFFSSRRTLVRRSRPGSRLRPTRSYAGQAIGSKVRRSRTSPARSTTPSPDLCSRSATRWPV